MLAVVALDVAFLPYFKNIIKIRNRQSNIPINGIDAMPMDAPGGQSMQVVPCLTYPSAQTKHNVPAYSFLHCSLVWLNFLLLQIDMFVILFSGQQRFSANSCASKEEYPTTHGEKISVVKSGLQNPGLAVSSASASPSLIEQSAPFGHRRHVLPSLDW